MREEEKRTCNLGGEDLGGPFRGSRSAKLAGRGQERAEGGEETDAGPPTLQLAFLGTEDAKEGIELHLALLGACFGCQALAAFV